ARLRLSSAQRPPQYTCAVSTSAPWGAGVAMWGEVEYGGDPWEGPRARHVLRRVRTHSRREEPGHAARALSAWARERGGPGPRDRAEHRRLPERQLARQRRPDRRPRLAHARGAGDEALRVRRSCSRGARPARTGARAAAPRRARGTRQ